jgi:hypothetical protein
MPNACVRGGQAAVDTASCLASPTAEWSRRKEVFDACAMYRATPEHAKIKGLKTKLQQDPALAKARSIQLNNVRGGVGGG